jgi:hypothetical protein
MWFGIGWRLKPWKVLEVIGITVLFTYCAGWLKGRDLANKERKQSWKFVTIS